MSNAGDMKQLYAVLGIVIILTAASLTALVLMQNPSNDEPLLNLHGNNGTTHVLSMGELLALDSIERTGSYENSFNNTRGNGDYIGAKIADIIDLIGGMGSDDIVIINATDGYSQTFTYENVYPTETQFDIQGDFALVYSFNGTTLPEYTEGPRLMFLPDDGLFSNADAALVIDPEYTADAAGPKLVSNVAEISVKNRPVSISEVLTCTNYELVNWTVTTVVITIQSDIHLISANELL
ncbi:MAG: hypothetical protein ACTSUO_03375 [Candidatus Thorarchaeota archaeon]